MEETQEQIIERYLKMSPEEQEKEATRILDEITKDTVIKEKLKKSFTDLLIFGKAEFVYREDGNTISNNS